VTRAASSSSSGRSCGRDLGGGRYGAGLEEQLLVDLSGFAFGASGKQFASQIHECARIAMGMIAEGGDQLRGQERRRTGLEQGVSETILKFLWGGPFNSKARTRLLMGKNSSVCRRSTKRPSPARTTVNRIWESSRAEDKRRISLKTGDSISWADNWLNLPQSLLG
jgi:hypothetical protein